TLTGGSDTRLISGGFGDDKLFFGSSVTDQLQGDNGLDELHGLNGNIDFFTIQFGLGADTFLNLQQGTDKIAFDTLDFNILPSNIATFFTKNTTGQATTADQRLIFETDTHILWADLDGNGAVHAPVQIATIPGVLLAQSDFE